MYCNPAKNVDRNIYVRQVAQTTMNVRRSLHHTYLSPWAVSRSVHLKAIYCKSTHFRGQFVLVIPSTYFTVYTWNFMFNNCSFFETLVMIVFVLYTTSIVQWISFIYSKEKIEKIYGHYLQLISTGTKNSWLVNINTTRLISFECFGFTVHILTSCGGTTKVTHQLNKHNYLAFSLWIGVYVLL